MSFVLSGQFDKKTAETMSERASQSDILGYPACAAFENRDDPSLWTVDIYPQEHHSLSVLMKELGEEAVALKQTRLPEQVDWVLEGLKDLKPVNVGRFFVYGDHDKALVLAHHHALKIEANQAFGTGHHGTTSACLEAIRRVTRSNRRPSGILDLGTGSGVLAAALAKQTKCPVLATDIDPQSIDIARHNMKVNQIAPLVTCTIATGLDHPVFANKGPFSLVVANILANPLRALAKPMAAHLKPNATIILSGLLRHQKSNVLAAYRAQNCYLETTIYRDNWATLILRRP